MVSGNSNQSEQERDAHEKSLKYYRDIQNVVNTSRQEGRKETIKEVVKNMKKAGFSSSDIAKYTGLSESKIAQL